MATGLGSVDAANHSCYDAPMPTVAVKSKGKKMDAIMGDAVDRLLTATKKKMLRDKGRIDYDQLAREGFSAAMIERLKSL